RLKKYEGNPMYPHSEKAERAMLDAIETAKDLNEFKERMFAENLNVKVAIALVKDQETARLKHFQSMEETVRADGPRKILEALQGMEERNMSDVMDLTSESSRISDQNRIDIAVDLLVDHFWYDFTAMENVEVNERAEVPSKWKAEHKAAAEADRREGAKLWQEIDMPAAKQWDPNWKMDYSLLSQSRHRRKLPFSDATLKRRIEDHKKYRGI
ncbi:MAG: hypothetical protein KDK33_04140, partial [Leptospiraceae bacterium]|nr:hypothetical protein [Leptospiraceae bacterium]